MKALNFFPCAAIVFSLLCISTSQAEYTLDNAIRFWFYYSASLCDPARLQKWDVGRISQTYPNFTDVRVVHNATGEALAYVSYDSSENLIYTVFRGTIGSVDNWMDDANFIFEAFAQCSGCEVDRGFYNHYLDLRDGILENLIELRAKHPTALIRIIGHSLGASGATLLGPDVRRVIPGALESLYTFGSPRVGNKNFADWWNSEMEGTFNVRLTHKHDPVPHIPPRLMGYAHVSTEYFYPSDDLSDLIVCSPLIEDNNCSNQYYFDVNTNDHITYMNLSCKELRRGCQQAAWID